MSKYDLIIFDCDGTLTDSEYVNNSATLGVLREEGVTQYSLEHAYTHWMGRTLKDILLSVQMETGKILPEDFGARYVARVAELQKTDLRAIDGADAFVEKAAARYKVCVASNGERTNVLQSLVQTDLMRFFTEPTVFTKVQVKNPKPAPDLFLFAAANMGVEPERCLVIEDSTSGVRGAVAAGMDVLGFTAVSHDRTAQDAALRAAGAKQVYTDFIHMASDLGL